jgi:hypothetical protein
MGQVAVLVCVQMSKFIQGKQKKKKKKKNLRSTFACDLLMKYIFIIFFPGRCH